MAHILVLAARVQAQRQLVQENEAVEDGARALHRGVPSGIGIRVYGIVRRRKLVQHPRIGFGEDRLHASVAVELMAHIGGQEFELARSQVKGSAVVGIDFTRGFCGRCPGHRYAHIGCRDSFLQHQLLGVRALERRSQRRGSVSAARRLFCRSDARILGKKRLPDAERSGG